MDYSQLREQLAEIQERGFDDSFIDFCASSFSSYKYPPENLAMARMHAHYLRIAIEEIVNTERAEALFEESPSEEKLDTIFDDVLKKSLQAALESSGSFCKLFVDGWCSSLSGDED